MQLAAIVKIVAVVAIAAIVAIVAIAAIAAIVAIARVQAAAPLTFGQETEDATALTVADWSETGEQIKQEHLD